MICLAGCQSSVDKINRAAAEKAKADASVKIVEVAKNLPDQPGDCRKQEASGVSLGERLDVALVRTDQARRRANARVKRCAGWYDNLREGYAQ